MGYRELLAVPLKAFLLMNRNVSRLLAEVDMHHLDIGMHVQAGGDSAQTKHSTLLVEMGPVAKLSPVNEVLDRAGLEDLRRM